MSDDTTTHRGKRRNIRRLTRRKIELPSSASVAPPDSESHETIDVSISSMSVPPNGPVPESKAPAAPPGGSIATSLAELRMPIEAAAAGADASAAKGEASDAAGAKSGADKAAAKLPPMAASELSEEEPATNPHIRPEDESPSDRPVDAAANGSSAGEGSAARATSDVAPVSSAFEDSEPVTGQIRKPESAEGARRRPDSDAPTRPRIELSSEMALAAGRVTSLEVPMIRSDQPKRGSKVPPIGEPRMISSLTGRRSSIPVRSDDDEPVVMPAVVVTRSKIISDRPPKPEAEPSPQAVEAERADVTTPRASRRPGAADGDEFETLDIDDGEVESPGVRGEAELDAAEIDEDESPAKAPPPPPKRAAAVPPAPMPPKAAPPPPPRTGAVTGPVAVAAIPSPTPPPPGNAGAGSAAASPVALTTSSPGAAPRKSGGGRQPRRRQWWETLFSDEYLRTVVRPTAAQISRQVDFMQASLGVSKGAALLDVGCGLGQHALEFARRGCLVVALDLALPMITRAAEDAQQEGLRINFLHKDIRDIGFEGTFDAVICVGTTFGFFDDEQNREVLGRLANALKPGGKLLLEVVNRDHVLREQPNLQWFEGDGCVVMEESDFNYYSSRLSVKRTMMREDGRQTESEYSIRLYALHELGQMMQQVGFRVKEVSGAQATRGVFFGAQSNRIILLAERRTANPARGNGHGTSDPPAPPPES